MISILTFWFSVAHARDIYVVPGDSAIENAIADAMRTVGRDTLILAPGDYVLNNPMYVHENLEIRGAGRDDTSIQAAPPGLTGPPEFWSSLRDDLRHTGEEVPPLPVGELFYIAPNRDVTFSNLRIRLLEADCENGIDDDGNGLADCSDPYCVDFATRPTGDFTCQGGPQFEPVCPEGGGRVESSIDCPSEGGVDTGGGGAAPAERETVYSGQPLGPYDRYYGGSDFRAFTVAPMGRLTLRNVWLSGWRSSFEGSAIYASSGGFYEFSADACLDTVDPGDTDGAVSDSGTTDDAGSSGGGFGGDVICDPREPSIGGVLVTDSRRTGPAQVTLDNVQISYSGGLSLAADYWWNGGYGPIRSIGARLDVSGSLFEFSYNWRGGAISAEGGRVTVDRSTFRMNSSTNGGAIHLDEGVEADIKRNLFCGNSAGTVPAELFGPPDLFLEPHEGGAIWAMSYTWLDVANNIFDANSSLDYGGALYIGTPRASEGGVAYPARVRNNTFVANAADSQLGSVAYFDATNIWFWNNLVAFNGDAALSGSRLPPSNNDTPDIRDNHIIEANLIHQGVQVSGEMQIHRPNPLTTVVADPLLSVWDTVPAPTDLDFGRCEAPNFESWRLDGGSPVIDAGRAPELGGTVGANFELPNLDQNRDGLLQVGVDVVERDIDGSPPDIGAFGGPDADVDDVDGDGRSNAVDCNDNDALIYPGSRTLPAAAEICDGKDNDCDLLVDEDTPALYPDVDGDGYGDARNGGLANRCELEGLPSGFAYNNNDCDDANPDLHGGSFLAVETPAMLCAEAGPELRPDNLVDQNCDGIIDRSGLVDLRWVDLNGQIVEEACDGLDNDCDGIVDEMRYDAQYPDDDGDDYGRGGGSLDLRCEPEEGFALRGGDCNDADATVYPLAPVTPADRIDQDCSGGDECYADVDGDGFGDEVTLQYDVFGQEILDANGDPLPVLVDDNDRDCSNRSAATSSSKGDCDDLDINVNQGRQEIVGDGRDQDCDPARADACWADNDGDGYGDRVVMIPVPRDVACGSQEAPNGSLFSGDCNDADDSTFPGNTEVCDGRDNDCDFVVDENPTVDGGARYQYRDADGDGVGDPTQGVLACTDGVVALAGFSFLGVDCDDTSAANRPGAAELCDGIDNDCNGIADEDPIDRVRIYPDGDGDGWGDMNANNAQLTPVLACPTAVPGGYVTNAADCDDADTETGVCATASCATGARPGGGVWALLVALAAVRRRRAA